MNDNLPIVATSTMPVPRQADTDDQLIELWLHGQSPTTQRAYRADIARFLSTVVNPLHRITLGEIQTYCDKLERQGLSPATRRRRIAVVKSLFAFGHRLGYLTFDVSRPVRLPSVRDTLSERILTEGEVQRMLALEINPRNHAILFCLYGAGLRASELVGLRWRDCVEREGGQGQLNVQGKGQKTRVILVPRVVWQGIQTLKVEAGDNDPVFLSRKRGHLHISQLWRIVRAAARRAGIEKAVSTHWWRHAHASHSLDHGAPIHLVQATLGHSSIQTTGRYVHARPSDSSGRYLPL